MKERPQKSIAHKAGQDKLSPFAYLVRLHLYHKWIGFSFRFLFEKKQVRFDLDQGNILKQVLF
jgi:hypothetical protein